MALTQYHGGQQDRSTCGGHKFHMNSNWGDIFPLESSWSLEHHREIVNLVSQVLSKKTSVKTPSGHWKVLDSKSPKQDVP